MSGCSKKKKQRKVNKEKEQSTEALERRFGARALYNFGAIRNATVLSELSRASVNDMRYIIHQE